MRAALAFLAYLGAVVAANYVTARYGLIPVGFGLMATAGTYFAGATFVLRDAVQDTGGRLLVVAGILSGAVLSLWLSTPALAMASGIAFLASEAADWLIYEPLRRRGYLRAALASNVAGAIVDTFLFLWLAGFAVTGPIVAGQLVGKLTITALVLILVGATRALFREPMRA